MAPTIKVAVLIYPGIEVIDMNGPIDVFVKANRYKENRYQVFTVAESEGEIKSELSAVHIMPDYTLSNCPQPDIIVIPGQIMPAGSTDPFGGGSDRLIAWIKEQVQNTGITIMSVCVGVYILANTGLLNNKKATTHWAAIKGGIGQEYPLITFVKNERFVADGNMVTTGGVTSGIDGALYLVSIMDDAATAQKIADIMVYNRDAALPPNTILP
jgi:transcriptional regulator GlxA family with amidase domain